MAHQTIDDHSLVESLYEVFRNRGYEGATLSQLADVTGLKKSSLYHRFPAGKDDMVKAVVLYVSGQLHQYVIEPILKGEKAPETLFDAMIATIKAVYSDGRKNCLLNVLTLGDANPEIKSLLNEDYNAWLAALIKLGTDTGMDQQEAEARAKHFLVIVQGALVVQRLTNNESTFLSCMEYEKKEFFRQVGD